MDEMNREMKHTADLILEMALIFFICFFLFADLSQSLVEVQTVYFIWSLQQLRHSTEYWTFLSHPNETWNDVVTKKS